MRELTNARRAAALVGVLGFIAIGVVGFGLATSADVQPATVPAIESSDLGVCPADWVTPEEDGTIQAAPGGNPCKDCKTPPGPQHLCTRISCDPCCWACVGEPYPICSS